MKQLKYLLIITIAAVISIVGCTKDDPVIKVTAISLNKTSLAMLEGESESLSATITPAEATNKKLVWSSDKTDIATVDDNGKVTALKAGTATITVTTEDGGKTATCQLTVTAKTIAVESVALNKSELTLVEGETETLSATVLPENATNKKVTWKSDKTEIATVDDNGKVTALKAGTATITVTTEDGEKTATCAVTVKAKTKAPDAPKNFTATAKDKEIELKWSTPNDGGSSITKYQYSCESATGYSAIWKDIPSSNATTTTYTVEGLTNNLIYRCEVRAVNAEGNGTSSGTQDARPVVPPVGQFMQDGIYYKAVSDGSTDVKVTNSEYNDLIVINTSYSGGVVIPATVEYNGTTYTVVEIGDRAFGSHNPNNNPGLTSVSIPVGVKKIGLHAFAGCSDLNAVSLPEGLESIDVWAFVDLPQLANLHLPASLKKIYSNPAFSGSLNLSITAEPGGIFSVSDGLLFQKVNENAKSVLVWIPEHKSGEYIIPDGVEYIGEDAIRNLNLSKITFPSSVISFNINSFRYCNQLVEITLKMPKLVDYRGPFFGTDISKITLRVPPGLKAEYEAHPKWGSGFKEIVEF